MQANVIPSFLSIQTAKLVERVPEFKFIQEEANKLGVKVYLFGGTASAFAHYVRWDLEREAGDEKYQAERFDYDFTNIYRGNQDLDIVVDGTAEQAAALQEILKKEYPHFVGSKEAWEVRLLRAEIGDKLPLLDNPDFLNQHTDTNSTGMIAVNADPAEIVFRDLFDWENPDSRFLNDVAAGRIKFLFSDSHKTTSRFKSGQNPPVFAAIRYLAKLAQYEVDEAEGDLEIIKRIVEGTDWDEVKNNSYVKHKLEEFGKKVLLNAPDSEYAWNLLEETGLKKRLIEMDGSRISSVETLSWWMSKEPLRTKPLGEGDGETAAEIFKSHINEDGEIVVAHETNSFEAYENITRSSHGAANAFISRDGVSGEAAIYGDGFYTRLGLKGARGTNLTIRFKLNPDAREGKDFIYNGDLIIIKNKAALELIQENLNVSVTDFLKLTIASSISDNDRGLREKLLRKFKRRVEAHELIEAQNFLKSYFYVSDDFPKNLSFDFSKIDRSLSFEDLYDLLVQERDEYYSKTVANSLHKIKLSKDLLLNLISKNISEIDNYIVTNILTKEPWDKDVELVKGIIENDNTHYYIIEKVLYKKYWINHYSLILEFINKGKHLEYVASILLSQEHWNEYPDLVLALIQNGDVHTHYYIIDSILSKEYWSKHPQLVLAFVNKNSSSSNVIKHVLSKEFWGKYPELVQAFLDKNDNSIDSDLLQFALIHEHWSDHPEFISTIIERGDNDINVIKTLSHKHWSKYPELVSKLIEKGDLDVEIIKTILSKKHWSNHPQLVEVLIKKGGLNDEISRYIFSKDYWAVHTDMVKKVLLSQEADHLLAKYVFSKEQWKSHPELIIQLIEQSNTNWAIVQFIFSKTYWAHHPVLLSYLNYNSSKVHTEVSLESLKKKITKLSYRSWSDFMELSKLKCKEVLI